MIGCAAHFMEGRAKLWYLDNKSGLANRKFVNFKKLCQEYFCTKITRSQLCSRIQNKKKFFGKSFEKYSQILDSLYWCNAWGD